MIKVTVKINGIEYSLKGREDEKYLKEVAEYVDSKVREIKTKSPSLSTVDYCVLAALNIADELYKADIELGEFNKKKSALEEMNLDLKESIKGLIEENEKIKINQENSLNEFNEEIKVLKDEIKVLMEEKNDLAIENNDLKKDNNILSNLNNKLNEEIVQVNNLSEILNKEIVDIKEKNSALEKNIDKCRNAENSYKAKIDSLNNEIKLSINKSEENKRKEQVLKEEINNVKKENHKLDQEINKVLHSKSLLEDELDIAQSKNLEVKEQLDTLNYDFSELEGKLENNKKELIKEKELNRSLVEELNSIHKSIKVLEDDNLQSNEDMELLNNEIAELKDEIEIKNNELIDARKIAERLSYEKKKIMENGKESRQELKTNKYKVLDLEKKLMDAQIEIAKLKREKNPLMK